MTTSHKQFQRLAQLLRAPDVLKKKPNVGGQRQLVESWPSEQRKFERVRIVNKALAISLNGIGHLLDISEGGFSAKFNGSGHLTTKEWAANIFISNGKYYVRNIPIKFIWEEYPDRSNIDDDSIQIVGVQFCELSLSQRAQLSDFIRHNKRDLEESSLGQQVRSAGKV